VHGFLSIPAIFRALYELIIAYNIILYNALDVFQETLYRMMKPMERVKSVSEIRRLFFWGYDEGINRLLAHCDAKTITNAMEGYKNT